MSHPETKKRWPLVVFAILCLIIIGAGGVLALQEDETKDPRSYDGKDPKKTGCEKKAETIGKPVPVMMPDGTKFGELHFRSSRSCGTVWGTIFTNQPEPAGFEKVTIESIRHKDGKKLSYDGGYDTNPTDGRIWGDMLGSSEEIGCVEITAQVFQNGEDGPLATTGCLTI